MTPKEKAKKLYEDFIVLTNCASIEERDRVAKKCCFITINELIESSESYDRYNATWAIKSTNFQLQIKFNKMKETSKNNETAQLGIGAVSSSALKLDVANCGWKVLSPDNKDKAVALFHRHDDAVQFAVNKWGKYAEWEVKSCDKRIPLHCY